VELLSLGYFGARTSHLDQWATFGSSFLGMQLVEKTRSNLTFRMDDRKQRMVVQSGDGPFFVGWEVADEASLGRLGATLEDAGVSVTSEPRHVADERRVRGLISFADPAGNRLEAFYGAEIASSPFEPGRAISGFRTGPLGMGHVVLNVESIELLLPFYRDILGFRLSDYTRKPFKAFFFHLNPRHHSFAMVETGKTGLHHLMMELYMLDDVGQAYDLAQGQPGSVATTLGRHTNDLMTSFYARSPSGFLVEYGWGGRSVDMASWQPVEMNCGPSLWGHERDWLSPEGQAEARALRLQAAAAGLREPVHVIEGNYVVAAGVCPWWDAARRRVS
jgi:2,3-dihydroxybiphenyl 1,2-dioxygenase